MAKIRRFGKSDFQIDLSPDDQKKCGQVLGDYPHLEATEDGSAIVGCYSIEEAEEVVAQFGTPTEILQTAD